MPDASTIPESIKRKPIQPLPKIETAPEIVEERAARPELARGNVWVRILAKGHGKIHTGKDDAIVPKISEDSERFLIELRRQKEMRREVIDESNAAEVQRMRARERERALSVLFDEASVEVGKCFAKGEVVQVPRSAAYVLEDRGMVELINGD